MKADYKTAYQCAEKIWRLRAQKFLSGTNASTRPLELFEFDEVERIAMVIRAEFGIVLPPNAMSAKKSFMQFVKPMPFAEALDKLGSQSPISAALSSSEWSDLPVELRENAFFSANVESLRFLQGAQDSLTDFLAGNVKTLEDGQTLLATGSRAAFVDQMQRRLAAMGVGREDGGITDITSERRLGLIFDIKTRQAGDYGYWRQGMDADVLNEFPASRFIRVQDVREPRELHTRFQDQVYLKTDPIWALEINRDFGVPWGPWGWGCGHDVEDVDRDEAEKLGLIKRGQRLVPQKKFLNTNLQASAAGIEPELLDKMKAVFGDQIVIEGETIRWNK